MESRQDGYPVSFISRFHYGVAVDWEDAKTASTRDDALHGLGGEQSGAVHKSDPVYKLWYAESVVVCQGKGGVVMVYLALLSYLGGDLFMTCLCLHSAIAMSK
jgi:hypothetical protein